MKRKLTIAGLAGALALAAVFTVGCGPKTATLAVELSDFHFTPEQWSVPAGAEVTITLKNVGTQPHEWVLVKKGQEITMPFDDDDEEKVFWEGEAEAGETETFTFTAPTEPGEYTIVCGTPAHLEQGMKGTLTIR